MVLKRRYAHVLVIGLCVLATSTLMATLSKKVLAERVFTRFVLDPIPTSVGGIRADRDWRKVMGHRYVLRFKINRTDLPLILQSRPFTRAEYIEYDNGLLSWGDTPLSKRRDLTAQNLRRHIEFMELYSNKSILAREPWWFDLKRWEDPEVHVFKDARGNGSVQILIYNEKSEEAYFIERKFAH